MASYAYLAERDINKNIVTPVFGTLIAYLPDSIILGTGIYALLTLSFPLMFLFLFELEALFAQNLLGGAARSAFPSLTTPSPDMQCKPGYYNGASRERVTLLKLFGDTGSAFPSRPLFLISGVFGYLMSSLLAFQDIIRNLDNDSQLRFTLAAVGAIATLVLLFVYYMRAGCETFLNGITTVLVGLTLGVVGMVLHKMFFGMEAINFLGLPTLVNKTDTGAPLYVCAPQ